MANEVKHGRRLTPEEKLEHRKYRETVNAKVPKSKTFSQCILAFLTGGAICCIGQLIGDFGTAVLNLAEREGLVMGVGAELFSLAGPVLVYGITSSVIVGIIAWLTTL